MRVHGSLPAPVIVPSLIVASFRNAGLAVAAPAAAPTPGREGTGRRLLLTLLFLLIAGAALLLGLRLRSRKAFYTLFVRFRSGQALGEPRAVGEVRGSVLKHLRRIVGDRLHPHGLKELSFSEKKPGEFAEIAEQAIRESHGRPEAAIWRGLKGKAPPPARPGTPRPTGAASGTYPAVPPAARPTPAPGAPPITPPGVPRAPTPQTPSSVGPPSTPSRTGAPVAKTATPTGSTPPGATVFNLAWDSTTGQFDASAKSALLAIPAMARARLYVVIPVPNEPPLRFSLTRQGLSTAISHLDGRMTRSLAGRAAVDRNMMLYSLQQALRQLAQHLGIPI